MEIIEGLFNKIKKAIVQVQCTIDNQFIITRIHKVISLSCSK